jgi:hypothetical protein
VAGYIAKYATKATESFGAGLDRRLTVADDLEHLDGLPAHVAELVRACWELGGRPELEGLRLRAWAHMLGFRGHWSTKSRRYSATMTPMRSGLSSAAVSSFRAGARSRVEPGSRRRATGPVTLAPARARRPGMLWGVGLAHPHSGLPGREVHMTIIRAGLLNSVLWPWFRHMRWGERTRQLDLLLDLPREAGHLG